MQQLNLKPTHKLVKNYYEVLGQFGQLNIDHEMAVRSAFQSLLAGCGHQFDLTLVPEYSFERPKLNPIRIDGALLNPFRLARGYWEAKDEHDDLDKEIRAKLDKGYPKTNIIFQAPERAVLYQHGVPQGTNQDISDPKNLVELLKVFFAYRPPHIEEWEDAVKEFKTYIPQIAAAVQEKIEEQHRTNPAFVQSFDAFYEVCRQSINPNLSVRAVEEMLVQHLLTERIFRRIFDNPDFTRRNVIAIEIEKVITSMTRREFSRDAFLKDLDRFYKAVELAAENTETYKEKQAFLNTVYERFFQGYSPKEADTHGIVYTPQPIVDFMVRSVEDILQKEFGRSLSDKGVHILDPFVGTGNFITRVMKEIRTSALPYKYENELHCNEVMLLPYYVASMNIEHEYMERTGEYKAFPGICLVDTFELAEPEQSKLSFMSEENTARVKRQKESPIFVIVGNPPYNAGQKAENDENRNRKYPAIDSRVSSTYGRASNAKLLRKLQDPYVKAIRWASDRISDEGIVAFVSNSSFIHERSMDGVRACLPMDFDCIYILDLGGNVHKNPDLSGTTHNVFGIQVGVSISFLVRRNTPNRSATIYYSSVARDWRKETKFEFLDSSERLGGIQWSRFDPDSKHNWLVGGMSTDFSNLLPLAKEGSNASLFTSYSLGISTNRDPIVLGFGHRQVLSQVGSFCDSYNTERARGARTFSPKVKWSETLKRKFARNVAAAFEPDNLRRVLYRPFSQCFLYFDTVLIDRPGQTVTYFPAPGDNRAICLTAPGSDKPFLTLAAGSAVDLHLVGAGCGTQCFPFYTYDEDGSHRRENITDWALNEFRTHYHDPNITKWDVFHYVYAVLHHPEYRQRYAANLKRELPRIPFVSAPNPVPLSGTEDESPALQRWVGGNDGPRVPSGTAQTAGPSTRAEALGRDDTNKENAGRGAEALLYPNTATNHNDKSVFWAFVEAGRQLANLHVNYEQQPEYPLERVEKGQLNWRVEKMRLSKDKTTLVYNDFLTLKGIPPEAFEYRLGNRSALEWVIDQYQVSTDKRSGITNDPNRADDPEYIVRLIGQVITVSLETMKIVNALPALVISQ